MNWRCSIKLKKKSSGKLKRQWTKLECNSKNNKSTTSRLKTNSIKDCLSPSNKEPLLEIRTGTMQEASFRAISSMRRSKTQNNRKKNNKSQVNNCKIKKMTTMTVISDMIANNCSNCLTYKNKFKYLRLLFLSPNKNIINNCQYKKLIV